MKNIGMRIALVAAVAVAAYGWQSEEERGGAAPKQVQEAEKEKKKVEAKVRELLKLTGAADRGKQTLERMMTQFRGMQNLPEGFVDKFLDLAKPEQLTELIVPIYTRHIREEDLEAAIAFFKTPSGQRWIGAQPHIIQDTIAAGQKWGRELAEKALAELEEEE